MFDITWILQSKRRSAGPWTAAHPTFMKSCTVMYPVRARSKVRKLRFIELQDNLTASYILSMDSTHSLLSTPWFA